MLTRLRQEPLTETTAPRQEMARYGIFASLTLQMDWERYQWAISGDVFAKSSQRSQNIWDKINHQTT